MALQDLIVAFGLALVLEGLLYAAFPDAAKRMLEVLAGMTESSLRFSALLTAVIGVAIVWLVRG
jgi:uncharacterized protein